MAAESGGNPILHSTDTDFLFFPRGVVYNLFEQFALTKFMFLNLVSAALVFGVFTLLASRLRRYGFVKGPFLNFFEAIAVYIRNDVVIPAVGKKDADRFTPLLWSLFFFILFGNLLGMLPWLGSPTGALGTTAALALCVFIVVHGSGIREMGLSHYLHTFAPPIPKYMLPIIVPIEIVSHLVRPLVLAFRLFVNMLAGHTVMFVFLSFIATAGAGLAGAAITGASLTAVVLLSPLELLVAFLQAFVFTVLTAVYIGGALHPSH